MSMYMRHSCKNALIFILSPLKGVGLFRPYSFVVVLVWGAGFRKDVIGSTGSIGSWRGDGVRYSLRETGWKGCGAACSAGFRSA